MTSNKQSRCSSVKKFFLAIVIIISSNLSTYVLESLKMNVYKFYN